MSKEVKSEKGEVKRVAEKPILFSGPMVRAILEGRKTQTRRIMKVPEWFGGHKIYFKTYNPLLPLDHPDQGGLLNEIASSRDGCEQLRCPYGGAYGKLWVRETWRAVWQKAIQSPALQYRADGSFRDAENDTEHNRFASEIDEATPSWRPSIFMRRWASRITLEITGVRVERLQDISAEDAAAEGFAKISKDGGRTWKYGIPDHDGKPGNDDIGWNWTRWRQSPVDAYEALWESINGPGSWAANPWVWVVEFKAVKSEKGEVKSA